MVEKERKKPKSDLITNYHESVCIAKMDCLILVKKKKKGMDCLIDHKFLACLKMDNGSICYYFVEFPS